jgi:hypothetical protein
MGACAYFFFALGFATMAAPVNDLAKLLPSEIDGWKPKGPDGFFDHDSLFKLINGGAEVYRALNVKRVVDRRYQKEDGPDIIVDVFDMGSSEDAFGAYHIDIREKEDVGVGQESEYQGGSLYFWKDRYFVSVVALKETEASKKAVVAMGQAIAGAIPREGKQPKLVARLPKKGLVKSQIHYFHNWEGLNRLHFIADENLLGLSRHTEGILARYRPKMVLVLIRYPHGKDAELAYKRFVEKTGADKDGVYSREGKFEGVRVAGDLLVGVFGAGSKGDILRLAGGVQP